MKLITLHNVSSTKSCILDIQENNFQNVPPNIAATSKSGKTILNLQNIFTKFTKSMIILVYPYYKIISKLQLHERIMKTRGFVN